MSGFSLDNYVDVAERNWKFYELNPDGRIVASLPQIVTIGDRTFIAVTAKVYRTPDDPRPCVGTAWEPFPGQTPYTRDSEMMNAETSAVGRALALAGIEARRSIASRDEVQSRQHQPAAPAEDTVSAADKARADVCFDRLKMLGAEDRKAVKKFAGEHDQKITRGALRSDPDWRAQVDELLDQLKAARADSETADLPSSGAEDSAPDEDGSDAAIHGSVNSDAPSGDEVPS
ncbi:MAG: hypothetical protein AAGF73_09010 [Actinomycetota bacterium]